MKKYIQTIVILLVVTLFFSCESDPLLEDFETTNTILNIESIEDAEATPNNRTEETNADVEEDDLPPADVVEEDDLPPSGKADNVEEDDLPPPVKTNNDNVEEDDLPPAEKKDKKKVEEDDLPPSGN
ncbi:hypothetical protein ACFO3O_12105 [Dokdonia ponticola]|uniref:Uncharacterized protein n=1 Tax=Dokdonia ponticola TaxID=2041041 RepID=A0ABV9HWU0_9FLAO